MPNSKGSHKTATKTKSNEPMPSESGSEGFEEISPTNVIEILHEDHLLVQDLFFSIYSIR